MVPSLRGLLRAIVLLGLLLLPTTRAHAGTRVLPDSCTDCIVVPDTCCEAAPHIQDPASPPLSSNVAVATRQPSGTYPYCVTIFDLNSTLPAGPEDVDWSAMVRYSGPGPGWGPDSLGTVFGLTLDEYGNIFVCHTSCYFADQIGQVFGAGPGAVYRIDATTGKITTFVKLPNFPDGSITPPENMPGLGNITYDCAHKQFFVTNMEDGKIYRIKPVGVNGTTGVVVQTFDPMTPDNGLPGFAPLGERLWAVQIHGSRVFYSVWAEDFSAMSATATNSIRSVGLDGAGAILPGTDKHELYLPPLLSFTSPPVSCPVSDISFAADGRMLLGERTMSGPSSPGAHNSRVLEYKCQNFCWQRTNFFGVGAISSNTNCAGGVDYDRHAYVAGTGIGRTWSTGDALHLGFPYPDVIYGLQGFRPTGGTTTTSMLIDFDGNTTFQDKEYQGDVEAPGCPPPPVGSICGHKYADLNHNGVQDAGEPNLSGWTITLTGPGGTYSAVTDANGNYCFLDVNPGTYTLAEVGQNGWIQTAPAGGTFTVTWQPGVAQGPFNFGNYHCTGNGTGAAPCVMPPPGMGAWWPFNEPVTASAALDVTHLSPARNVAQLYGGAAIFPNGEVGNRVCFQQDLDYARVANGNQLGIQVTTGSFAIDGWLKLVAGVGGQRMIAEKRVLISAGPYKTRGWALYLNGTQLFLEIGTGGTPQIVPGPVVTPATWTHIAVSVDRGSSAGVWYLNGAPAAGFNFVPIVGNISNVGDVYMGKSSPSFPPSAPFQGCIDELEFFTSPLAAASVQKLYLAGSTGKCLEYCRVPSVTTICKTATSVTVCMNICNNGPTAQSYHWSLAGLPAGPGCTVAGPVTFSPPAGSIVVPPGSCSAPICVTIPRPAGLTAQNATSCFSFSFVNDSTGACHTCTGTIRADNTCWCITPINPNIIVIPGKLAAGVIGIPVVWPWINPCPPIDRLTYSITAISDNPDHADPLAVSLNGLPPGTPYFGTLDPGPAISGEISVPVSYPGGYDPGAPYQLLLQADVTGTGVMEPIAVAMVAAGYDTAGTGTTVVPPTQRPEDSVRLAASPNPFTGGSTIAFSMSVPEDVEMGVFDLSGRLVRTLQKGRLSAGPHSVTWDGHQSDGRHAPAGVYFVRFQSERLKMQVKLVKLR